MGRVMTEQILECDNCGYFWEAEIQRDELLDETHANPDCCPECGSKNWQINNDGGLIV